jgi:16S rRNA (guanine527-N7)-methyltransferase
MNENHLIYKKNVSRETLDYVRALLECYEDKFKEYTNLLLWWNKKVNLLSRSTTVEEIEKHIEHSLFISVSSLFPKQKYLVDIGTGGGLPGIPLAICYSDKQFVLLDRISKKSAAVHDMIKQLNINNAESKCLDLKMFHVEHPVGWISKHAVKLDDFMKLTAKQEWNTAYFLKGNDFEEELNVVKTPLKIISYNIESAMEDAFYIGKCVLQIQKNESK